MDGKSVTADNASRDGAPATLTLPIQGGLERIHEDEVLSPAPHSKAAPLKTPVEPKVRVELLVTVRLGCRKPG